MAEKVSRPPSVWITQILLELLGRFWGLMFLAQVFMTITRSGSAAELVFGFFAALVVATFSLVFLAGFGGLVRRRVYGRWIGVIGVALVTIVSLLGSVFRPGDPSQYYEYTNSSQIFGAVVAQLTLTGLLLFLAYRLACGNRANSFFRGTERQVTTDFS